MAFQHNAFGHQVATTPAKAHARLVTLFKKHDLKMAPIAKELGASTLTLRRWIAKLVKLGYSDPADGQRAVRGTSAKTG